MRSYTRQSLMEELFALKKKIFLRYNVKGLELFGSFARNEQDDSSDIDLLVDFTDNADLFDLVGLNQFLEQELQRKVDVVPKQALRDELVKAVFSEALSV